MKLTITRHDEDGREWTEGYEVPDSPGLTVLDAVIWVREHHDASIGMRFSCRSANACRECISLVNGERTYACTAPAVGEVSVAGLPRNRIRDLVTGSG